MVSSSNQECGVSDSLLAANILLIMICNHDMRAAGS